MSAEQKPQVDELFGDDDAGMDPPPPGPDAGGGRKKRGAKFKLIVLLLVVILGAVFWFVSSAHHEQFYLTVDGKMVKVERGWFFPVGAGAWYPRSRAYTPFRLPEGVTPEKTGAMSLEEIDTTLYALYVDIARQHLTDFEMGDPDTAEEMLHRANSINGLSVANKRNLDEMEGDVAFRRGLKEVRGIQTRFDLALEQFEAANRQGGVVFQTAEKWAEAIRRHRDEYERLVQESGLKPEEIFGDPQKLMEAAQAEQEAAAKAEGAEKAGAEKKVEKKGEAAAEPKKKPAAKP